MPRTTMLYLDSSSPLWCLAPGARTAALGLALCALACAGPGSSADSSLSFTSGGDPLGEESSDGSWTGSASSQGDESGDGDGSGDGGGSGVTDLPAATCGDGLVQAGEACDDGNGDDGDLCTNACVLARCGDGRQSSAAGEACDDGDQDDGDGCDADCQPSAVVQVEVGEAHSCALTRTGQVLCWGRGSFGALGYGDLHNVGDDESPRERGPVPLGAPAVQISAGSAHSCAVLEDGTVRCWGSNVSGRLGTGSWLDYGDDEAAELAPALDFGSRALEVHAGVTHTCARLENGDVHCWGSAASGVLGTLAAEPLGDDELATTGPALDLGGPALDLAVNGHSCARVDKAQGSSLRCWGSGGTGQLGNGQSEDVGDDEAPSQSAGTFLGLGAEVDEISVGYEHTCARINTVARCWGNGFMAPLGHGKLEVIGDDEYPLSIGPVGARVGEHIAAVAAGRVHTCVLLDSGRVRCWGYGDRGRLGPYVPVVFGPDVPGSDAPAEFAGSPEQGGAAIALSVGGTHSCVLTEAGAVRCWGANEYGQLGYGHTQDLGDDFGEFNSLVDVELF